MRHVPVLIAGGGPVGMTLARTLGRLGVRCLLVERNAGIGAGYPDAEYEAATVLLKPGDRLYLYSDGVRHSLELPYQLFV